MKKKSEKRKRHHLTWPVAEAVAAIGIPTDGDTPEELTQKAYFAKALNRMVVGWALSKFVDDWAAKRASGSEHDHKRKQDETSA